LALVFRRPIGLICNLNAGQSVFKPAACFGLPKFVAQVFVNLGSAEEIFEGFVCEPSTPIPAEACPRQKDVGHQDSPTVGCIRVLAHKCIVDRLVALENLAMHFALVVVPDLATRLGEHGLNRQEEPHLLWLEDARCGLMSGMRSPSKAKPGLHQDNATRSRIARTGNSRQAGVYKTKDEREVSWFRMAWAAHASGSAG
jgi:hypothetical protein